MSRNRKLKLTSGPAATGQVVFLPLSGDSDPLNGVTLKGPDSVGASAIELTLPPAIVEDGVVKSDINGKLSLSKLLNINVDAAAAIAVSKLAAVTASRALASDGSGFITPSATTSTELGYVSGVTSAIQTQIDSKQPAALTSAHILVGDGSNLAADVAMSGDIAITNAGITSYSGTVPLNKGGTGQTTKAPACDALSPMTTSGDIIYGGASGTGTRLPKGTDGQALLLASGIPAWTTTALTPPRSELWFIDSPGRGSVGTRIFRFTTKQIDTGSCFTYNQDATNGDSITINQTCVVSINLTMDLANGNGKVGFSLNSNQLATNIESITTTDILGYTVAPANNVATAISLTYLATSGDVIRVHGDGTPNSSFLRFRITQVSQ